MQNSDTTKKPIAIEFNEERLRAWKEKRAKIAAASRQERARQAEAERTDRARLLEEEREDRLRMAAEARAAEEAAKRSERLQAARIRLAGRADVDAARKRLVEYRRKAKRRLAANLLTFVGLPTVAFAVYLFVFATPLYEARTQFSIRSSNEQPLSTHSGNLLALPAGHQEAAQLRAYILSPQTMESLDRETGFFSEMASPDVDVLSRLMPVPALQITQLDQYRRSVRVKINSQEGILTMSATGRDPEQAERYAATILTLAETYLAKELANTSSLHVISSPTADPIPAYPRRASTTLLAGLGLLAMYAMFSIFAATLRRHGQT